jgi:hypothetical protein
MKPLRFAATCLALPLCACGGSPQASVLQTSFRGVPQAPSYRMSPALACRTLDGVNDRGDIVGDYVDKRGNTNGFLCT